MKNKGVNTLDKKWLNKQRTHLHTYVHDLIRNNICASIHTYIYTDMQ